MSRAATIFFTILLTLSLALPVCTAQAANTEDIQQLEERLNALEQEATALRSELAIIKSQVPTDLNYDTPQRDPLLGTWECTNNVFTYELSLMQNNTVIIKEMSSGSTSHIKWTRRGKEDIVISNPGYRSGGSGKSFRVVDLSEDRMSLEEPNTQSIYDCFKISQE